ncbi:hypothetical protein LVD15_15680 [Fulvivirga maritima]|uniref:hypothetical protein n=1 Tax=Fulvivirga maritima TaxID=2904247 RepID=UPI001F171762|nr:hypothetical protein [Fulvivirga maritima]UII24750.1 hypothetical protein LVD15_15680 [Fulvivirga maritima]
MSDFLFETNEFGLSQEGFHLLRDRFNYKTYPYSEIDEIRIETGKELKNWTIILAIGISLVVFSIYYSVKLYLAIQNNIYVTIYIEQILIPIIPFLFGGYCIYASTKSGTILRLKTLKKNKHKYPLELIEKENKLKTLEALLKEKLKGRFTSTV